MEIRVRRELTGRQWRHEVLQHYGDVEAIQERAEAGDHIAGEALWMLRLQDEDPSRLDHEDTIETVTFLDRHDLSKLTQTRIQLLDTLRRLGETNLKELTHALGRDVKNVSQDLRWLEELGLVTSKRVGRQRRIRVAGNEIVMKF